MGKLKWRPRAAVVGYLDVIFALFGIIGTIVSAVSIAVHDHKIKASVKQPAERLIPTEEPIPTNDTNSYYNPRSPVAGNFIVPLTLIWVSIGVASLISVLQLVSAIKMLKATEATYESRKAICPTKFWICLNIVIVVISAPFYIFIWGPLGSAGYCLGLIFRVAMIYVVCCFLQELQAVTRAAQNKQMNRIGPV